MIKIIIAIGVLEQNQQLDAHYLALQLKLKIVMILIRHFIMDVEAEQMLFPALKPILDQIILMQERLL